MNAGPPVFALREIALFLDFDGTLVELAPQPEAVIVPSDLPPLLARLLAGTGGAVATISGRPIAEVDGFLKPLRLPASGAHGAELRETPDAEIQVIGAHLSDPLRAQLQAIVSMLEQRWPGLRTEDKGTSFAIHYRHAAEAEPDLRAALGSLHFENGWQLLAGHRVFEVKARGWNKATAVQRLMEQPAFAGRRPLFIGDDRTDLDGMAAARALGGDGVAIGGLDAEVAWALSDPAAVRAWLKALLG
ncbi:trehalose-phosphatase [Dongia sp.]|uniref:trehalose-phosphatase n=1 Tax=Dongia sp. TaxID=1977262 RepID=UPI00375271A8